MEYVGQPVSEAQEYKATLDFYNLPYPSLKAAEVNISDTPDKTTGFSCYPNPVFDGTLHVQFDGDGLNSAKIYSLDGKLVYQQQTASQQLDINTSNFSNGIYILLMNNEKVKISVQNR